MDIGALLGHMDIEALLGHMDIEALSGHMDIEALLRHMDIEALSGHMDIEALLGHMDIEAFLGHMEIGAKCQGWYSWDTIPFATQIWSFGTGGLLKESYSTVFMKSCDIFKWSPKTGFIVSN